MEQPNGTIDVRVRYLEQITKQLSEQIKVMKQLVTTEVSDLKSVMQQQVSEIKQIVMHQDRVYQERIRRLESRIEQLSEFAMQLARTTGSTGAMQAVNLDQLAVPRSLAGAPMELTPSPRHGDDDDDDEGGYEGVEGVMMKYQEKINAIYDYYTQSNIQVFHPAMTITHFTKLCKDCNLCTHHDGGTPAELLWMAVLRKLGKKKRRRLGNKTSITTGKFKRNKETNFAFERLDEIPKELFGQALYILAQEKIGKERVDLPPEHLFETFLVVDIFPHVDPRLAASRGHMSALSADISGATSIQEYKTDAVRSVMKDYLARLRESYTQSIQKVQRYTDEVMTLDGFVEFVRRHDLMSLISKPDIRQIYLACCQIEMNKNPKAKADTISIPSFMLTIYHLADRIYGASLYLDKYPTPEARVQKLLAKMFLLS